MKIISKLTLILLMLTGLLMHAKNISILADRITVLPSETLKIYSGDFSSLPVFSSEKTNNTLTKNSNFTGIDIGKNNFYEAPINVHKLMRKVQRLYNRNKPKKSHIARAYFRETGNYKGNYVFFYESRGYSIFMRKPWTAALFSNYKFFPEQSRISNIALGFQEEIKAISSGKDRTNANFKDVGFSNNENNYRRFQEYGPLSKKNHRKFRYSLDSVYENNGMKYYKISFIKDGFQGFLVVNSRTMHLVETEYKTDRLISSHNKKYVQGKIKLSFLYEGGVPYLSEMESKSTDQGLTVTNYLKIISDNFSGFDVTEKEYWAINLGSLYADINYKPEKWPDIPYYQGDEFKKINEDLSDTDKPLNEQFIENSQQALNPNPDSSITLAEEKIRELKKMFGLSELKVLVKKGDHEQLIEHLNSQKEEVERKEKQLLKEDLIQINKAVEADEITEKEATEQKKAKALKRAKNINDQQDIIQASIDLIARNKDQNDDSLYYRSLAFMDVKIDTSTKNTRFHKTFGSLVIGTGFSNARSNEISIGDRFRVAGSRYFEIGYKWSTGLTANNFLRFNYGLLFQFDGFKPKNHNQYFKVKDDNRIVLEEFPNHLKKAKLRTSNLIIPLHFEIGPANKNGYRKNFQFGVGGFAGLNLSTIQKLKYKEENHRHKRKNHFNSQAEDFVYGWSGYIGYKNTALILRYHMNSLFKHNTRSDQTIALGIRWSL